MQKRALIFWSLCLGGFLVLMAAVSWLTEEDQSALAAAFLIWVAIFVGAQFLIFRCPHCSRLAFLTENRSVTPFVGSHCRHCGEDY
jgi:hypothetical protein